MIIEDCDIKMLKKIVLETESAYLEITDKQIKDGLYEEASHMLLLLNDIKIFREKYFPEMNTPEI